MHSNVDPASEEENVKLAELVLIVPDGPESIVVSGGVVSDGGAVLTVNVRVAGVVSVFPAASVAWTEKV